MNHVSTHSRVARWGRKVAVAALSATVLGASALMSMAPASAATSGTLSIARGGSATSAITSSTTGVQSSSFTVPSTSARSVYLGLQFRSSSVSSGYRTRVAVAADGTLKIGFSRVVNGSETLLLSEPISTTVQAGTKLNIEGSVTGTSPVALKIAVWTGSTKPAYQKTYSDSSASRITSGSTVRAWGFLSGSAGATSASVAFAPVGTTTTTPTTTAPVTTTTGKPSASTTGPTTTSLTRKDGNMTITTPGTVIQNMDIYGFVTVKAANVTIKNSIVRGGTASGNIGIITNYGYDNLLVQNVLVQPRNPSVWIDGVKGWDFTLDKVHVVGGVDNVKIHGPNVTIKNSLLEDTNYFSSDPNQGGSPTHNDNIQILQGTNLVITNSTVRDTTNFTVLVGAEQNNVSLNMSNNWLDGGHCTVKLQNKNGHTQRSTVSYNKFGPNRAVSKCILQSHTDVSLTATGNTMESTGSAVSVLWDNA